MWDSGVSAAPLKTNTKTGKNHHRKDAKTQIINVLNIFLCVSALQQLMFLDTFRISRMGFITISSLQPGHI
jgi:hypothetical protein